jgi:hypothetical protein
VVLRREIMSLGPLSSHPAGPLRQSPMRASANAISAPDLARTIDGTRMQ